jgi:hypothetical protein
MGSPRVGGRGVGGSVPGGESSSPKGSQPQGHRASHGCAASNLLRFLTPRRLVHPLLPRCRPAGGDLVLLAVPSEKKAVPCRVVSRARLGLAPGPVALAATWDRLLLAHPAGAAAFAAAAPAQRLLAPVVSQLWGDIWRQAGLQRHAAAPDGSSSGSGGGGSEAGDSRSGGDRDGDSSSTSIRPPLLVTAGQLVITSLGPAGAALFLEAPPGGAAAGGLGAARAAGAAGGGARQVNMEWLKYAQPFILMLMIGLGIWQFRRAASGLGPGGAAGRLAAQRRAAALLDAAGPDLLGSLGGAGAGGGSGYGGRLNLDELYGGYGGGAYARRRRQQQQAGGGGGGARGSRGPGGLRRRGGGGGAPWGGDDGGDGLGARPAMRLRAPPLEEPEAEELSGGEEGGGGGSGGGEGSGGSGDAGSDGARAGRRVTWSEPLAE